MQWAVIFITTNCRITACLAKHVYVCTETNPVYSADANNDAELSLFYAVYFQ